MTGRLIRSLASACAGLVLVFGLPLPALAQATEPAFTDSGFVRVPAVIGQSVTQQEFYNNCPGTPQLQGHDAYIFSIPETYASEQWQATVSSDLALGRYDLDFVVAGADCRSLRAYATAGTSEVGRLKEGARYIVAWAWQGTVEVVTPDRPVFLRIDPVPGSDPSPTPTPTPDPTATTEPPELHRQRFFFHRDGTFGETPGSWTDSDSWFQAWLAPLPGTLREATIDLWYRQKTAQRVTFNVWAYTYEPYSGHWLGNITVEGSTQPARVNQTFADLDIPVDGRDFMITAVPSDGTSVLSDSRQHPSGFIAGIEEWQELDRPAPHQPEGEILLEQWGHVVNSTPVAGTTWVPQLGVTGNRFLEECAITEEQGFDGFVFELPNATSAREQVTVFGHPESDVKIGAAGYGLRNLHDVDAYFFDSDCQELTPNQATSETDEFGSVPPGTKWLLAHLHDGSEIDVHVTLFSGPGPDEEPPPPRSGTRGSYPLVPSDAYFGGAQPDIDDLQQWGIRTIDAPQAWQQGHSTGDGVKVAVLDTGVDLEHPDLQCFDDKIGPGWDFSAEPDDDDADDDYQGHGTHVAGIIGACTDNGTGTAGVAPDATILPYRLIGGGDDDLLNMATAIRRAADDGAHVINMSFSSMYHPTGYLTALPFSVVHPINEAIDYATQKGVVVVASAGNAGGGATSGLEAPGRELPCGHPAGSREAICVGATNPENERTYYSNRAEKFAPGAQPYVLVAPGGDGYCDEPSRAILSLLPTDYADTCDLPVGYGAWNGTSMAAPHVAGVAALLYERIGGERTPCPADRDVEAQPCAVDLIREALLSTATDLGAPGLDPEFGWGLLNADAAVRSIEIPWASDLSFSSSRFEIRYGDGGMVGLRLFDGRGEGLVDRTVSLSIETETGSIERLATTGDDGSAQIELPADLSPGTYELIARFEGEAGQDPATASADLVVVPEVTLMSMAVTGHGASRVVTARLTDDEHNSIRGMPVAFYVDGSLIGSAVTDATGRASLKPPSPYRGDHFTFTGEFSNNGYYEGSTGSVRS